VVRGQVDNVYIFDSKNNEQKLKYRRVMDQEFDAAKNWCLIVVVWVGRRGVTSSFS
jgi:hypothetical protein